MSPKDALFSFEGRLRRREWWLGWMGLGVISYVVTSVIAPLALGDGGRVRIEPGTFTPEYPTPLVILMLGLSVLMMWPYLALTVKRAHDRGRSGRFLVGLILVTNVVSYAPIVMTNVFGMDLGQLAWVATGVSVVIGLYLLVVLGVLDGTPGPNRYGPSPKGLGDPVDTFT